MPSRVRFAPRTQIYVVPSLSDIPPSALDSCHYSDAEFEAMQRDAVRTIRAMRRQPHRPLNEDKMTVRGLEQLRSPEALRAKKQGRDDVVDAVLDEQDRQWAAGYVDDEDISRASRRFSAAAVEQALALGASDAAFVRSERAQLFCRVPQRSQQQQARTSSVLERARVALERRDLCTSQPQQRRHTFTSHCEVSIKPPTANAVSRSASLPGKVQGVDCSIKCNGDLSQSRMTLRSVFLPQR